ncbi:Paraflagellar rod protein [Novymonas esmeraldas]|uniref:Paraflagellar rod protein n=1 Tax=Novymonas esmeraldas TaxID=1808958 RepID=A0AAW0ELB6_9TRYP
MYPDRRPYATTVPHSGYRAKPLVPQPPADALTLLRSHVGYDDLRNGGADRPASSLRTVAGRTYLADGSSAPASAHSTATQQLLPLTDRSSQEALDAARLQPPIEHASLTYHGCQQAALNAELREKVEVQNSRWTARVAALQAMLVDLPMETAVHHTRVVESLHSYLDAYRCTEDLSITPAQVAEQHTLRTPVPEMDVMTNMPVVPMDGIRRALDDLLRAPFLLAPLDTYLAQLSLLDSLGQLSWTGEGESAAAAKAAAAREARRVARRQREAADADADADADVADGAMVPVAEAEEDIHASRAAVALHERLHYNPGDYAQRELKKSEEALRELQARVQTVKRKKEEAIDAADPLTALRNLHAQVDYSNDLLLLYKARMALVALHSDDVRGFRGEVVGMIDDSRQAVEAVQRYAREALPSVHRDVGVLAESVAGIQQVLVTMQETEVAADTSMRANLGEMDKAARALWEQASELLVKLVDNARERSRYSQQCMSLREQRAREIAATQAQLRAQSAHCERLRHCEEVLARWAQAGDVFGKYVDACVPKLLKHLAAVEDGDVDLAQREAEEYVGFFEQFVYAAEEARAKRCTQAERMRLLQRSTQLNQERASETMDPDAAVHDQRLADATRELDEVQLYLSYVADMVSERRAEVDPVLQGVLVRHTRAQMPPPGTVAEAAKPLPTPGLLEDRAAAAATAAVVAAPPTDAAPAGPAVGDGAVVVAAPAAAPTMAHPLVTARLIGLAHEHAYMTQHQRLVDEEMHAVEAKRTGLRHSRAELQAMASKYKNGDDIRELLGLDSV